MGRHLFGVGRQVALAEHHAPRRAEAAGGEQDHPRIRWLGGGPESPRRSARERGDGLVADADRGSHVFQVDDPAPVLERVDQILQLALVDETARGQDGLDPRRIAGRPQIADAGGEIQHGRRAAEGVQGEEGDHHRRAGRQQHAHALAFLGEARNLAPQRKRRADQVGIGEGVALLVLQDRLFRAILVPCVEQGVEHGSRAGSGVIGSRHLRFTPLRPVGDVVR